MEARIFTGSSGSIRVVYKLERQDDIMKIIIVSARADNKVYDDAGKRREEYGL